MDYSVNKIISQWDGKSYTNIVPLFSPLFLQTYKSVQAFDFQGFAVLINIFTPPTATKAENFYISLYIKTLL